MSAWQLVLLPRAIDCFGAEDLKPGAIDIAEDIEHTVVITDTWSPDAFAINVPAFKTISRTKIEFARAIAGQFPVHQILGVQNFDRRHHVHGGPGEVIVITDTNWIRVFKLSIEQWV